MFKVEHTGERFVKGGRTEKVGPRVLKDKDDNYVTIKPGEVKDLDLSDEVARITIGLDGGPLKFHLTDEQAERLSVEVITEKPVKMVHGIPENWKELPWNDRRALAVQLANGKPVHNGSEANAIIKSAMEQRNHDFRLARKARENPNGLQRAHSR